MILLRSYRLSSFNRLESEKLLIVNLIKTKIVSQIITKVFVRYFFLLNSQ